MNVEVLFRPVPNGAALPRAQRVTAQRAAVEQALTECAAGLGLPPAPWPRSPRGVPRPLQDRYYWSLTHKPAVVAVAIATQPVGIDLERIVPRRPDLFEAAGREDEWALFQRRDWPAFFRLWTAKEATLKVNSVGIGRLESCRLLEVDGDHVVMAFDEQPWRLQHYWFDDYVAAVTVSGSAVCWRSSRVRP